MQYKPDPIPMTQLGYDNAKVELDTTLKYREEVLVRLQRAREMGDLSENGAYKAARFELSDTDRKIRRLKLLSLYGKVTPAPVDSKIGFNSRVTVEQLGKQVEYHLVSEYETDPKQGKISIKSPIGKALLGKSQADTVVVTTPSGEVKLQVIQVA